MAEFGIEISQEGVPVDQAADTQKVLDSRWKFLNIAQEARTHVTKHVTVSDYFPVAIAHHGLGYPPAFTIQINSYDYPIVGGLADVTTNFFADDQDVYVLFLYFKLFTSTADLDLDITTRVFDIDVTKEYKAPIEAPFPNTATQKHTIGARILTHDNATKGMGDPRTEDFSLDTQAKAISVQQHGIKIAEGGYVTIQHDFGTPPAFMATRFYPDGFDSFALTPPFGKRPVIATMNSTEGIGQATPQTLRLTGAQGALTGPFAYMLFKDPLEVAL